MLFDIPAKLARILPALFTERLIIMEECNLSESHKHVKEEEREPDAFALAVFAYHIHTVVPVTGTDERQAVVLSVLTDGLVGDIDIQVGRAPVGIQGSGEEALITAQLPLELSQAEWDIYKVWRGRTEGGFTVEREHVLSSGPLLSFTMAVRENEVQDAVLVHARSGTVLVCQTPAQSKS